MGHLPGVTHQTPGVHDVHTTFESVVSWGDQTLANLQTQAINISGAARDESHTGRTTYLRPGLLMSFVDATKLWLPYDSAATGVNDNLNGVLSGEEVVQVNGVDTNKQGVTYAPHARIKLGALWTNDGTAGHVVGHLAEATIVAALIALGYLLDDWYENA